ncbi:MAG TPA: hypothetical protein VKK31_29780, partial [Thermoanaerobaculia bacterium]|nr:hypothetical protein [Thermoanaerobaculia bacterium]
MMKKRSMNWIPLLLLTCTFVYVQQAAATTVVPPADMGELVRVSRAVVFAQAIDSRVEEENAFPHTITRFQLLQAVAGADPGLIFEVSEPGGSGRLKAAAVPGAPRFESGRNYLLFLDDAPAGRWRSKMMAYGLLEEVEGADLLRPLPEAGRIEVLTQKSYEPAGRYRKGALLEHLRQVARGARWNRQQVVAAEAQ